MESQSRRLPTNGDQEEDESTSAGKSRTTLHVNLGCVDSYCAHYRVASKTMKIFAHKSK